MKKEKKEIKVVTDPQEIHKICKLIFTYTLAKADLGNIRIDEVKELVEDREKAKDWRDLDVIGIGDMFDCMVNSFSNGELTEEIILDLHRAYKTPMWEGEKPKRSISTYGMLIMKPGTYMDRDARGKVLNIIDMYNHCEETDNIKVLAKLWMECNRQRLAFGYGETLLNAILYREAFMRGEKPFIIENMQSQELRETLTQRNLSPKGQAMMEAIRESQKKYERKLKLQGVSIESIMR